MPKNKKTLLLGAFLLLVWGFPSAALGLAWNLDKARELGLPGETSSITSIIEGVTISLLYIFGFLGIIAFVISGILYLTAGGDAEQEKKAKKAMTMAVTGVVVGLLGLVIIQAVDLALRAITGF